MIYKEKFDLQKKSGTVAKLKLVTKIKNDNELYFEALVSASQLLWR